MSDKDFKLSVFLAEYNCLKSEQAQRIGFRDNLLYVTLGVFGGVVSFSLSDQSHYYALLVVPWICLILGWTYITNDEKISAIGQYIRNDLADRLEASIDGDLEEIFGWELAHRSDKRRRRRKIQQLIMDEITFVFSGVIALFVFLGLVPQSPLMIKGLACIEFFLLITLGAEIFIYTDLTKEN